MLYAGTDCPFDWRENLSFFKRLCFDESNRDLPAPVEFIEANEGKDFSPAVEMTEKRRARRDRRSCPLVSAG